MCLTEGGTRLRRPRWPRWVYGSGAEPDYRFSFANERTFLAWIRTSLALIAGGVALNAIELSMPDLVRRAIASVAVVLGMVSALVAWIRWAAAERAIRQQGPLPALRFGILVAVVVAGVAMVLTAMLI